MSTQKAKPTSQNRELSAEDYLKEHKIYDLLTNLTAQLVFHQPESPKTFITEYLEKLRKAKVASLSPPTLFEENNLQSIFGMLDPSGKGYITYKQYTQALDTLGIIDYDQRPEGFNEDKIRMDIMIREARKGLNKAHATFKSVN